LFQAPGYHSLVIDLVAFGVDGPETVTDAIHASPSVAATDDCDELAALLVVVGCDELAQRLLGGIPSSEGNDVLTVAAKPVLADGVA
jgi:hypothetical protein